MEQKLVYLHTDKNLEEAKQILEQEEMEILLKTDTMYIDFSDMTEEEQSSWIKLMRDDLEDAVDDLEIFYRKIQLFNKKNYTSPENVRKMFEALSKSNDYVLSQAHIDLIREIVEFGRKTKHISYFTRFETHNVKKFGEAIRCSCIIARKGTDIVRYLEFLKDPILTINGPNATSLKSSLEKQF